jgi:hypothetical protein
MARLPMTPEEVAACYDGLEGDEGVDESGQEEEYDEKGDEREEDDDDDDYDLKDDDDDDDDDDFDDDGSRCPCGTSTGG